MHNFEFYCIRSDRFNVNYSVEKPSPLEDRIQNCRLTKYWIRSIFGLTSEVLDFLVCNFTLTITLRHMYRKYDVLRILRYRQCDVWKSFSLKIWKEFLHHVLLKKSKFQQCAVWSFIKYFLIEMKDYIALHSDSWTSFYELTPNT